MSDFTKDPNIKFMSISEFKTFIDKPNAIAQVVKNPNTGKVFLAVEDKRFRCASEISNDLPLSVLIPSLDINGDVIAENDRIDNACLVNADNTANVVFTL